MSSIGNRIHQARRRRGLALRDLSELVGVSHTMLNKYEKGDTVPDSAMLIRIAKALDLGLEFFLRPQRVGAINPAYRKQSRMPRGKLNEVTEIIRDWLERYLEAEELSPSGREHKFEYPDGFPRRVRTFEAVEKAAERLREVWSIGLDPIEDLMTLLEDKGIRIGSIKAHELFDACAFKVSDGGEIPVIAIREDMPGDRQRFTLAHELGHLMLKVEVGTEDRWHEENACNRFAGAFLAPSETFTQDVGERRTHFSGPELHSLKHKYGLSMEAIVFRAKDLKIISEYAARDLFRAFRANNWRKAELGIPVAPERPARFRTLVQQALAEQMISRKRASQLYPGDLETEEEREAFGGSVLEL